MFGKTAGDDVSSAMGSLFRVRSVESPADKEGQRTIWHRGLRKAELVTWVDSSGLVTRQAFALFDDVVVWERGHDLKTGQRREENEESVSPADHTTYDAQVDSPRLQRLSQAIATYKGNDSILLHLRELLRGKGKTDPDYRVPQAESSERVRPVSAAIEEKQAPTQLPPAPPFDSWAFWSMIAGLVVIVVALVILLIQ